MHPPGCKRSRERRPSKLACLTRFLDRGSNSEVSSLVLAMELTLLLVQIPPPLCRGKSVGQYDPAQDTSPSARAVGEVQAAYEALCPKNNCGTGVLYKNPTIGNNAVTWVSGVRDGAQTRAKIVYSSQFLDALAASFGPGASFGVLAHEVGHHLTAALSLRQQFDSSWDEELRADYLAGCALGRSGHPPDALENALRALASTASPTHPSFAHRTPVVRKGYDDCRGQADAFSKSKPAFGLGSVLKKKNESPEGCWSYWFRLTQEMNHVGPLAARRRRSRHFASKSQCEKARRDMTESKSRATEECTCE